MSVFAFPAVPRRRAGAALAVAAVLLAGACSSRTAPPVAHGAPTTGTNASALPTVGPSASTLPDLPYAALDPAEHLDLYLPTAGPHPAPLLIWIHGGGWRTGDKTRSPHSPGRRSRRRHRARAATSSRCRCPTSPSCWPRATRWRR